MSHEVFFLFYFFLLYSFFSLFFVLFSFFFLLFHSSLCSFPFTFLNSLHAPQHRERTEGKSKRQEETEPHRKTFWNIPLTVRNYFFFSFLSLSFSTFKQMDQSLRQCIVCRESLCDPIRTLPCLHSACLSCLDQSISHSNFVHLEGDCHESFFFLFELGEIGKAPYKCPVCRGVFEIPTPAAAPPAVPVVEEKQRRGRKGKQAAATVAPSVVSASALPVNLFASSVLAIASGFSAAKVNPNEIKCEICEEGGRCHFILCAMCPVLVCWLSKRTQKRKNNSWA